MCICLRRESRPHHYLSFLRLYACYRCLLHQRMFASLSARTERVTQQSTSQDALRALMTPWRRLGGQE